MTHLAAAPTLMGRHLAGHVRERLRDWSVAAQQRARHNAMVALTECTERRVEREDVEQFFADLAAGRTRTSVSLRA